MVEVSDDVNPISRSNALSVTFERPKIDDAPNIWNLAQNCTELDLNSPYTYLLWCRDFSRTSAVAYLGSELVGFVSGYVRPDQRATLMIWQVGVAGAARRHGVGTGMIRSLVSTGTTHIEATVTNDNDPSKRMFIALARHWKATLHVEPLFVNSAFPSAHATEYLYRIGPLDTSRGRR